MRAVFGAAGDREILLYRPDDERRGGCAFYRDRVAPEYKKAEEVALLEHRARDPSAVARFALVDGDWPKEIKKAAYSEGVNLAEELRVPYYRRTLVLVRAAR